MSFSVNCPRLGVVIVACISIEYDSVLYFPLSFPRLFPSCETIVRACSVLLRLDRLDDGEELLRDERRAADEEAVHVLLRGELVRVAGVHRAAVEDAHAVRDVLRDLLRDVLSDERVCLLRLLRRGGAPGADGPHRLVGEHDAAPVVDVGDEGVELAREDLVGAPADTVRLELADARQDVHARGEARLRLGADELVGLAEDVAALGVPEDDPLDAHVLELVDVDLAGERALLHVAVLRGDLEALLGLLVHSVEQHERGREHDLDVLGELRLVEVLDQLVSLGADQVALPVSTDEELARHCCFLSFPFS